VTPEILKYPLRLAYDTDLCRPGCVLLQAAMGGSTEAAQLFDTKSWLLAPTPGLKVRQVDDAELMRKILAVTVKP
jgi:hypothetical protein